MKIKTKDELIEWGITVDGMDVYLNGKLWKPYIISARHKYGKTMQYYVYYATVNKKQLVIMQSNIMYCWYNGDRDITKDVDHINNNSLDDRPENLQLLTRRDNLLKRGKWFNQWDYIKGKRSKENDKD